MIAQILLIFLGSIITYILYRLGFYKPKAKTNQEIACRALEQTTGNLIFRNIRPDFLKNPLTKRNLELDCYDPTSQIAVEYDGEQHYKYPNYFHKTESEFKKQQARDKIKDKLCIKNGIKLIRIPYTEAKSLTYDKKMERFKDIIRNSLL